MLFSTILFATLFSTIDSTTLKPSNDFPPNLKKFSDLTNIPIKVGLFHFLLYFFEANLFPTILPFHIGQRLSTMWLQAFENPRWGQHFHMQVETLLQLIDLEQQAQNKSLPQHGFMTFFRVFSGFFMLTMIFTNCVTSSAYHTLKEQLIGAFLAFIKLIYDYSEIGNQVNFYIGRAFVNDISLTIVSFIFVYSSFIILSLLNDDYDYLMTSLALTFSVFSGNVAIRLFR